MNPQQPAPPKPTHWPEVLIVFLAGVSMAMHVGKVPPAIPLVSAELGLDLVLAGWLLSLFALIGAATGSFMGRLVDRLGQRRTLLFGLACTVTGSLAGAGIDNVSLLLAARALEGIGFVSVVVAAPALIFRECQPKDHRLALGLWSAWMPVGASLMMGLSPFLLSIFGWRANWLTAAGTTLAALLLAWRFVAPDPPFHAGRPRGRLRDLLALPAPWILALSFCVYSMSYQTVFGFLPTYLTQTQGLDPALAARLTALAMISNMAGNLSAGWFIRHLLKRWQLIALACLTLALCAWGIFSDALPFALRYALCLAFSAVGGVIPAAIFISAPGFAPTPQHVGTIGGMIVQGLSIGQLCGAPILGYLVHLAGSWTPAPYFISGLALTGLLLAFWLGRLERAK